MKKILIAAITLTSLMLGATAAMAVTLSGSPSPGRTDIRTTFRVVSTGAGQIDCYMQIDPGDGSGFLDLGRCLSTTSCTQTYRHTYRRGNRFYTVRVRTDPAQCAAPPLAPTNPSISYQVCARLFITSSSNLPSPTLGVPYSQQIQTRTEGQAVSFKKISGSLPPGITLSAGGLFSGTPTALGSYSCTVQAVDNCPKTATPVTKVFNFGKVKSPPISVSAAPSSLSVPRRTSSVKTIRYSFSSSSTQALQLTSSQGVFYANGRNIGTHGAPVNTTITGGSGSASESLTIPVAVLERAIRSKVTRIIYRRQFSYLGQAVAASDVGINITTGALADFGVSTQRIAFSDNRAEITVKKNKPFLRASTVISYRGSGQLRGFWEVDGRPLAQVIKNLVYGKSRITLTSPIAPALPTFITGSHRVRFVISHPKPEFEAPVAVYFVTAEDYEKIYGLFLDTPPDGASLAFEPISFTWHGRQRHAGYVVQFYPDPEGKAVLTAQTRGVRYNLPAVLLKERFKPGESYRWSVKSVDAEGEYSGESKESRFHFK